MDNENSSETVKSNPKNLKTIIIVISVVFLLCISALSVFVYKKDTELKNMETVVVKQANDIVESENTISTLQNEVNELNINLTKEKSISTNLLCRNLYPSYWFSGINFSYNGNKAMHRDLENFVENMGDEITNSDWDTIWGNVDVAMHKITVKDNIRYYFITYYDDLEYDIKDSVFWVDKGCYLDYPNK